MRVDDRFAHLKPPRRRPAAPAPRAARRAGSVRDQPRGRRLSWPAGKRGGGAGAHEGERAVADGLGLLEALGDHARQPAHLADHLAVVLHEAVHLRTKPARLSPHPQTSRLGGCAAGGRGRTRRRGSSVSQRQVVPTGFLWCRQQNTHLRAARVSPGGDAL